jgi:hypothetical protein
MVFHHTPGFRAVKTGFYKKIPLNYKNNSLNIIIVYFTNNHFHFWLFK